MPFSNPLSSILNKNCVSLQVTRHTSKNKNRNHILKQLWKRVFLLTSRGSVTIEATIAISIFLIVSVSLSSFLVMVYGQLSIEEKINNISMETSKAKYFVKYDKEEGEKYKSMTEVGYISARVFSDIHSGKIVEGLNPVQSHMDNGMVDVVLSYNVKIPFTSFRWNLTQRARTKDWTGVDLTKPNEIVYITKYGTVYHRSKECKHLVIKVNEVSLATAKLKRNVGGHKYSRCSFCVKRNLSDLTSVFITPDGARYHSRLDCLGLTRSVIEIDIKDVGDKKPCSSCGG